LCQQVMERSFIFSLFHFGTFEILEKAKKMKVIGLVISG
jgi:hypothetical protein